MLNELMGPNYQMVQKIEEALIVNPRPFYNSFGDEDAVKVNIEFMASVDGIDSDDINVVFKAAPEKFVRGIVLEMPECKQEMDSKFLVISYIGHDYEYFTCELMEGENFALRCNEDQIIKVYSHTPTADEIWDVVQSRYEKQQIDGLYFSVLYDHVSGLYSYVLFDNNSKEFLTHWFGTPDLLPSVFSINETEYTLLTAIGSDNAALFRSENGVLQHVQYGDADVLRDIRVKAGI